MIRNVRRAVMSRQSVLRSVGRFVACHFDLTLYCVAFCRWVYADVVLNRKAASELEFTMHCTYYLLLTGLPIIICMQAC